VTPRLWLRVVLIVLELGAVLLLASNESVRVVYQGF
jgi:hypothetical protein